jgi:putative exosortase-associated protein (TIGR04073 family)
MRHFSSLIASAAGVVLFAAGCAGPEQKLGRGINNTYEIVRGGEFRRTIEQTALNESPEESYTWGVVRGVNRSLARTGIGLWEIVTFPFPNHDKEYKPICTDYLSAQPVYPDSYRPRLIEDTTFATDTSLGFSGGDVAPMIPGSRFRVFDN